MSQRHRWANQITRFHSDDSRSKYVCKTHREKKFALTGFAILKTKFNKKNRVLVPSNNKKKIAKNICQIFRNSIFFSNCKSTRRWKKKQAIYLRGFLIKKIKMSRKAGFGIAVHVCPTFISAPSCFNICI